LGSVAVYDARTDGGLTLNADGRKIMCIALSQIRLLH